MHASATRDGDVGGSAGSDMDLSDQGDDASLLASGCNLTPESVVLREERGMICSSSPILSTCDSQCLNDLNVANLNALAPRPSTCTLRVNYPRDGATEVAKVFRGRRVAQALDGTKPLDALAVDYQQGGHWYTLKLSFPERLVYYFEAFGSYPLGPRSAVTKAMNRECGKDWRTLPIDCRFQTCASACGLWVVQVHHAFVDYLDSGQFRTGCFKPFLVAWMAERGVSDLKPLEGTPAYAEAAARNMAYITAFRHEARDDLAAAAAAGRLAWAEEAAPAPAVDSELERRDEADVA